MCDCRSFARFLIESKETHKLLDIEIVRKKERVAREEFISEMRELIPINNLYQTEIKPLDYDAFLERIIKVKKKRELKILEY